MVKPVMLALAITVVIAGPVRAAPDWNHAGGDIFAGAASAAPVETAKGPVFLPASRQPYDAEIVAAATRYRLDPKLLHALVTVESAYRPRAVSLAGAGGLTQLMPTTASELGVQDRFDTAENLAGGAAYLARQLVRFGDVRLALAAYNAGPDRVARLGVVPPFAETRQYVDRVVECYLALSAGRTVRSARDCRSRVR